MLRFTRPLALMLALWVAVARPAAGQAVPTQAQGPKSNLAGFWNIAAATDTDNEPYTGRVNLAYVTDSVYQMMWDTDLGAYVGVGLRLGPELYCAFGQSQFFGVSVYRNLGSYNGRGRWAGQTTMLYDEGRIYPETLDGPDLPPGATPSGMYNVLDETSTQAATLELTPVGTVLKAVYTLGNPADEDYLVGVGLMHNNRLVVAWSRDKQIGVGQYTLTTDERQAQGQWAVFGVGTLGTENLAR